LEHLRPDLVSRQRPTVTLGAGEGAAAAGKGMAGIGQVMQLLFEPAAPARSPQAQMPAYLPRTAMEGISGTFHAASMKKWERRRPDAHECAPAGPRTSNGVAPPGLTPLRPWWA
jgi:hypothetical protein